MRFFPVKVTDDEAHTLERWLRHMVTCARCVRASGSAMALSGCTHGHYLSTQAAVILGPAIRSAGDAHNSPTGEA